MMDTKPILDREDLTADFNVCAILQKLEAAQGCAPQVIRDVQKDADIHLTQRNNSLAEMARHLSALAKSNMALAEQIEESLKAVMEHAKDAINFETTRDIKMDMEDVEAQNIPHAANNLLCLLEKEVQSFATHSFSMAVCNSMVVRELTDDAPDERLEDYKQGLSDDLKLANKVVGLMRRVRRGLAYVTS
jgi:hypothetical protein